MGEPETPHFHHFGICEQVISLKKPVILISGDTRTPNKSQRQFWQHFGIFVFINLKVLKYLNLQKFGTNSEKTRADT